MKNIKPFLKEAEKKAFDYEHRKRINHNISKYDENVPKGRLQFEDYELARDQAAYIKRKAVYNLEKYLLEFELNFKKNGGEVLWAEDAAEANDLITDILKKHDCKTVVKSKSMITEEIQLNPYLKKYGIEPIETDLGEYIVQLCDEPPYHIVTPAMHKSKEDVAALFHEKLGTPENLTPTELTLVARKVLRDKFVNADAGITGANFIIADSGAISLTENEGNARLSTSIPKIHIAVAGIERIIPSIHDLALFLPLLSTAGTGQNITTYNTLFFGPKRNEEMDGPEKMYVVLLDNGRTNLLAAPDQKEALACIRCGACLNACPVYKNIGGHTYNTVYNGPIGAVITPFMKGFDEFAHLSYATSLCGSCSSVCPVKIPLDDLLLKNKHHHTEKYKTSKFERFVWKNVSLFLTKRNLMNFGSAAMKNALAKIALKNSWNKRKSPIKMAKKSFNQQWKEKYK
ncbi:MAG: iron-sulfur cluster-binding protein [Bacteroidetes bacterium]|nr:iron-sulfur cluster-binding protein [Bacteroidota bacterium]MBT4968062.1 iron-sulfur cluster-binding protein [Bacteroidota bacterium]MBT6837001.1 iron-sulfur cluster-binding protein [Bacteroidota bacterium]